MWELDYTEEVKLYFVDNGDLVFDVLVKIEELKFFQDAMPLEGCIEIEPDIYLWKVLGHTVIYRKSVVTRSLMIAVIKPAE